MQDDQVVAYALRLLKDHEKHYLTHGCLELALVVFPLRLWWHYLYGESYEIYTDHKDLKYLFTQNKLNKQRRWLEIISNYQCQIKYHLGKANLVIDALS